MYYGGSDPIDWSYILTDNGRTIHIPTNKQGCCPWPWLSLRTRLWSFVLALALWLKSLLTSLAKINTGDTTELGTVTVDCLSSLTKHFADVWLDVDVLKVLICAGVIQAQCAVQSHC